MEPLLQKLWSSVQVMGAVLKMTQLMSFICYLQYFGVACSMNITTCPDDVFEQVISTSLCISE